MVSRSFWTGLAHATPRRRSLCAFTWVPSPNTKRPPLYRAKSHAKWAKMVGVRGKATAMAVPKVMRWLCSAAMVKGKKGSLRVSEVQTPSKPMASAACVKAAISPKLGKRREVSNFMDCGMGNAECGMKADLLTS